MLDWPSMRNASATLMKVIVKASRKNHDTFSRATGYDHSSSRR